jgi:hypothetical protein
MKLTTSIVCANESEPNLVAFEPWGTMPRGRRSCAGTTKMGKGLQTLRVESGVEQLSGICRRGLVPRQQGGSLVLFPQHQPFY